jgi:hypothetical protein
MGGFGILLVPVLILLLQLLVRQSQVRRFKRAMHYGLIKVTDEHGKALSFDELRKQLESKTLRDELVLRQVHAGKIWTLEQ